MHSALQRSGPSPYSLSLMASVMFIAVTAYPQSLDTPAFCKEKANAASTQCTAQASKSMTGSLK
jgi:hypothetical protein